MCWLVTSEFIFAAPSYQHQRASKAEWAPQLSLTERVVLCLLYFMTFYIYLSHISNTEQVPHVHSLTSRHQKTLKGQWKASIQCRKSLASVLLVLVWVAAVRSVKKEQFHRFIGIIFSFSLFAGLEWPMVVVKYCNANCTIRGKLSPVPSFRWVFARVKGILKYRLF